MIPAALLAKYPGLADLDWSDLPGSEEGGTDVSRSESAADLSHEYYSSGTMSKGETGAFQTTSNQTQRYVEALEARPYAADHLLDAIFIPQRLPGIDVNRMDEYLNKLIESWRPGYTSVKKISDQSSVSQADLFYSTVSLSHIFRGSASDS